MNCRVLFIISCVRFISVSTAFCLYAHCVLCYFVVMVYIYSYCVVAAGALSFVTKTISGCQLGLGLNHFQNKKNVTRNVLSVLYFCTFDLRLCSVNQKKKAKAQTNRTPKCHVVRDEKSNEPIDVGVWEREWFYSGIWFGCMMLYFSSQNFYYDICPIVFVCGGDDVSGNSGGGDDGRRGPQFSCLSLLLSFRWNDPWCDQ